VITPLTITGADWIEKVGNHDKNPVNFIFSLEFFFFRRTVSFELSFPVFHQLLRLSAKTGRNWRFVERENGLF